MIKAIIFDYFKTITLESELGVLRQYDPSRIYEKEIKALIEQYDKGKSINWLCEEISKINGTPANELVRAYNNQPELKLNIELIDFILNELKGKYKIGLLSNIGAEPKQLANVNNHLFFDDKVLSFEVGIIKPDPAIYLLAAKRLDVMPEECIFVDDIAINVNAAESTGMKGIMFKNYNEFLVDLNEILKSNK